MMSAKPRTDRRSSRIRQVLGKRQKDLTLVINNVHDPHNVSAILRSCDAFGLLKIHLLYTSNVFPALGKKSSASALKWVERIRHPSVEDLEDCLSREKMTMVRTGFSSRAVPVGDWDFTRPTAVIIGNEHSGVEQHLQDRVDREIYIPMLGMVQSFNVSVASAIILYEAFRQRMQAGFFEKPALSPQEMEEYFKLWIEK